MTYFSAAIAFVSPLNPCCNTDSQAEHRQDTLTNKQSKHVYYIDLLFGVCA